MILSEQTLKEFIDDLNKMTTEELMAKIDKAREDSKNSKIMENEDVVHVIRCKNCYYCERSFRFYQWCRHFNFHVTDDWFCADGERYDE